MGRVKPYFGKVPKAKLPTRFGDFTIYGFKDPATAEEAVALLAGKIGRRTVPLVRMQSQCLTCDTLASLRCDCGEQLRTAMHMISESKSGILIYQQQEGRGIGLINKLLAYELQDKGADPIEANKRLGFAADQRNYVISAEILKYFRVYEVRLLSNNPHKVAALERHGVKVRARIPLQVSPLPSTVDRFRNSTVE